MADAMDDAFADDDDEVRGGCWSEGLLNAPPTTSSAYFVYEACLAGTFVTLCPDHTLRTRRNPSWGQSWRSSGSK